MILKGRKEKRDAGLQYRCGRLGRGIQPPSTAKVLLILNACFSNFQFNDHGWTNGPTDGPTYVRTDKAFYRVACPQVKSWKLVRVWGYIVFECFVFFFLTYIYLSICFAFYLSICVCLGSFCRFLTVTNFGLNLDLFLPSSPPPLIVYHSSTFDGL